MGSVTRHWGNTNRANTRIYKIWSKMKDRCTNPNNQYYHRYGGRGIHYWYTWQSFEVFAVWAFSNGYEEHLTLDRIDNDGDYTPFNCRWVTTRVQNRNKRNNVMVTIGEDTLCLTDMCKKYNIKRSTVTSRLNYGWDIVTAITTPTKGVGSNQNTYKEVNSNGKCK